MADNIHIRKATEKDIPFIREAIIEAEKSGTDKISYCNIYSITEDKFHELLYQILMEDIEGQEWCINSFLIAEIENESAGACAAWIEGFDGSLSSVIKSNILFYFLGDKICNRSAGNVKLVEEIKMTREKNAIQIESLYIKEAFRKKEIAKQLINEQVKLLSANTDNVNKAQIILSKSNSIACQVFQNLGFKIIQEKCCEKPEISNLLPSNCMIMLEKSF